MSFATTSTRTAAANTPATMIDLRSDTVTRPTAQMRAAMAEAIVGDDQYGEDPAVNELEAQAAHLMGKEAAVFVPSGTMGNLSSVLAWCGRGVEALLGSEAHILWYESGGVSALGGVPMFTIPNDRWGQMDLDAVQVSIRPDRAGYPPTGVICVENTHNRCGGVVLSLEYLRDLRAIAQAAGVPVHMDGARIFNAAAALGVSVAEIAAQVDSVQFCLSKGLAAPVGSLVAGDAAFIDRVRAQRKILGGAMRQSGVIAAAGLVAFETMIERLPEDHRRARTLAEALAEMPGVRVDLETVQTNIIVFQIPSSLDRLGAIAAFKERGLLVSDYGTKGLRLVTHYEVDDDAVAKALEIMRDVLGMGGKANGVHA